MLYHPSHTFNLSISPLAAGSRVTTRWRLWRCSLTTLRMAQGAGGSSGNMAKAKRTDFDSQMLNVLDQNDVGDEVKNAMRDSKCFTVPQFANCVEERTELFKRESAP